MPPSPHSLSPPPGPPDDARDPFARALRDETDPAALCAVIDRVGAGVPEALARSFGPYGAHVLVTRALARAQADHPALAAVQAMDNPTPRLTGLAESAGAHGARATADGVLALLAALSASLGRLIGDDLASSLLARIAAAPPAGPTATEP